MRALLTHERKQRANKKYTSVTSVHFLSSKHFSRSTFTVGVEIKNAAEAIDRSGESRLQEISVAKEQLRQFHWQNLAHGNRNRGRAVPLS